MVLSQKSQNDKEVGALPFAVLADLCKGAEFVHPVYGRCRKKSDRGSRANNGLVTVEVLSTLNQGRKQRETVKETRLFQPNTKVLLL